jgi:hypothetical protein
MSHSIVHELVHNILHNLFKPLLLFFYLGFLAPILKIPFEFPKPIYQGITLYLLIAIGWHGGEELASLGWHEFAQAGGFMVIGFLTNTCIGFAAYVALKTFTNLRRIDAATVAGYYGSDSAGTFVTCVGVLTGLGIAYSKFMPVMLAVMEIPGCLVALYLASRLRHQGMDAAGNMPWEPGYTPPGTAQPEEEGELYPASAGGGGYRGGQTRPLPRGQAAVAGPRVAAEASSAVAVVESPSMETEQPDPAEERGKTQTASLPHHANPSNHSLRWKVLHEVFLNPGLFLLFGGIAIGFIGRLQGATVTAVDDPFFITMFQGVLCLFLLEMGLTACQRLRDLKTAGLPFLVFGVAAPNVFAFTGIVVAHGYAHFLGEPLPLGTYVLFSVLCAAASYIAMPAVQRLAIPEASPTLPLAASLGLTFSYNVTIGIPLYLEIAKAVTKAWPVLSAATGA